MYKIEHGGNLWELDDRRNYLDFSANINPLGFPDKIKDVIIDNLDSINSYPDPNYIDLRKRIAEYCNLSIDNIFVGNGANELIHLLPRLLDVKKVLIPVPSFKEYEIAALAVSAEIDYFYMNSENDFNFDIPLLLKSVADVDMLIVGNPNNPTGNMLSIDEMKIVLNQCDKYGTKLVVDESFIDFCENSESCIALLNEVNSQNLIVIRSMTKFFSIPGLRLGYMVANSDLINQVCDRTITWNVNVMAQQVGETLFDENKYVNNTRSLIDTEKTFLTKELGTFSALKAYSGNANYLLCEILDNNMSSADLYEILFKNKIIIRDCSNFRGLSDKYFRLAVRTRPDNIKLIKALKEIYGAS